MTSIVTIQDLNKSYSNGFEALKKINLDIKSGEIFALLGPNGAGKTSLISAICGLAKITSGTVKVAGFDNINQSRSARSLIGLVPQELNVDSFETVWGTVNFSRGLFGKSTNHELVEQILKDLSLWDKRKNQIRTLSGGMKRRVMIAKALSHEPQILFLDEPTAGVDVELRKDMWKLVHKLRETGVTIILTTHYIEEAEEMADRVGVISNGELILVEEKKAMLKRLGQKQLILELEDKIDEIPESLQKFNVELNNKSLTISYHNTDDQNNIMDLIKEISLSNIKYKDLQTKESSLEEIFVELVKND